MKAETKAKRRDNAFDLRHGHVRQRLRLRRSQALRCRIHLPQLATPKSEKPARPKVRMWQLAGKWTGLPPEDDALPRSTR